MDRLEGRGRGKTQTSPSFLLTRLVALCGTAKTAQWVGEEIKMAVETGQKVVCLIPSVLPLQNLGCVALTGKREG